jgi:anti-sigma factor RsiW
MPDHDLIAALAEGRLDATEAATAERAIAADPAAAAMLAAHRTALTATRAAEPAILTETERRDLRASVADAVGLERSPQPAVRRRAPWAAISIAAATLAALVAVVPLAGLLTDSGDSAAVTFGTTEIDDAARMTSEESVPPALEGGTQGAESDAIGDTVSTTAAAAAPAAESLEERLAAFIADPVDLEQSRVSPTSETLCGMEASKHIGAPLEDLLYAELILGDAQALVFFRVTEGELTMAAAFAPEGCLLIDSLP